MNDEAYFGSAPVLSLPPTMAASGRASSSSRRAMREASGEAAPSPKNVRFDAQMTASRPVIMPAPQPSPDSHRRQPAVASDRPVYSPAKAQKQSDANKSTSPSKLEGLSGSLSLSPYDPAKQRRMDMQSIFSNTEARHALDPSLCFCEGPGPNFPPQPLVDSLKVDGKHKTASVHFGANQAPRFPEYRDPYKKPEDAFRHTDGTSSSIITPSKKGDALPSMHKKKAQVRRQAANEHSNRSLQSSLHTVGAPVVFDSSSYPKPQVEYTQTPSYINSQARANLFRGLLLSRGGKK